MALLWVDGDSVQQCVIAASWSIRAKGTIAAYHQLSMSSTLEHHTLEHHLSMIDRVNIDEQQRPGY